MNELKFVDIGEGITEGHVRKWMVKDSDNVAEDQTLVQVETDKAVVNLPAPISGVVKIVAKENSDLHIGDVIALIGTKEEIEGASTQLSPSQSMPKAGAQEIMGAQKDNIMHESLEHEQHPNAHEILATPYVRKLARDLSVDLSKVHGTGPNGRIVENDIRSAGRGSAPAAPVKKFSEVLEDAHKQDIERIPLTSTRKAIAKNMEASWTIPRAVHMDLINATSLYGAVSKEKERAQSELNVKLTFLPFIIKAVLQALKENPNFNASYDHESLEIIRKNYYNIGIAAQAPDGLKVVVIKNADKKSIIDIAKELQELGEKVKNETISLDEMKDSTFTITNIGSLKGGFLSVPMINHPDVAILGIHMIRDMPVVVDNMVKVGKVLPFSISFDHRVIDGFEAVKFGNALIKYLEDTQFLEML